MRLVRWGVLLFLVSLSAVAVANAIAPVHPRIAAAVLLVPIGFIVTWGRLVWRWSFRSLGSLESLYVLVAGLYLVPGFLAYASVAQDRFRPTTWPHEAATTAYLLVVLWVLSVSLGFRLLPGGLRQVIPSVSLAALARPLTLGGLLAAAALLPVIDAVRMFTGTFGYGGRVDLSGVDSVLGAARAIALGAIGLLSGVRGARRLTPRALGAVHSVVASWALLAGAMSGMKEELLRAVLVILLPWALVRGRIPRVGFGVGVLALVASFAVTPALREVILRDGPGRREAGALAAAAIEKGVGENGVVGVVGAGLEALALRTAQLHYMFPVVASVPVDQPHRGWGRFALLVPTAVLPRALWPEKPVQDEGRRFQSHFIADVVNSTTPLTPGFAYWDGGIVGVVMLGVIVGVLGKWLAGQIHGLGIQSPWGAVAFLLGVFAVCDLELDPFWQVIVVARLVLGLIMAGWVVRLLGSMIRPERAGERSRQVVSSVVAAVRQGELG